MAMLRGVRRMRPRVAGPHRRRWGAWLGSMPCLWPVLLGMGERGAFATEIRDGDAFSFSVPAPTETCLQFPPEQFDHASCPGLQPIVSAPTPVAQTRVVAIGRIFFDDGGSRAAAFLLVSFLEQRPSFEVQESELRDFVDGELRGLVDRSGADRGASRVHSAAIVTIAGVRFVRSSVELMGLPAGKQLFERVVGYVGRSYAGHYQVMVGTDAIHAAALEALLDSAAGSLRIARPAPPAPSGSTARRIGYRIGQVLFVVIAVAGVVFLVRRGKIRRAV
jgi:hypothetical protein